MTKEALKLALEKIATVNAMDYEYQAWAREALREHAMREVQRLGQEIEQEPVVGITAIRTWFKDGRVVTQTLCNSWVDTAPPQRTWVDLTDEEIDNINYTSAHMLAREVLAKLKEKNT